MISRHWHPTVICAVLALAVFNLVVQPVYGRQTATGTIEGRVLDQQDAVVQKAAVRATNEATGTGWSAETNTEGRYSIPNLAPGVYRIEVSATGFANRVFERVTLRVGQTLTLDAELGVSVGDTLDVSGGVAQIDLVTAKVDGVVTSHEIERLPLNGRNYLELAFLTPGTAPAPNFDPTKTNTVGISSAGQLGRGGNVSIDGSDNNDDVVGGSLVNISQEAVQEFQIATNQYSAVIGRSSSSVINVVTKSGTNDIHGSGSLFFRDRNLQALPATFDRTNEEPPFDRQQYAFAAGGPIKRDRAWWFGAVEYRNQDAVVLVGSRDVASRTIRRSFASAPLDDLLVNLRADWKPSEKNAFFARYSLERQEDIGASTLQRAIGSATQRQAGENNYQAFLANWTRAFDGGVVNSLSVAVNNFINRTTPVTPGPQLTFPSLQDGASFRVPQQTRQNRFEVEDTAALLAGDHAIKFGGELHRIDSDFVLDVFRDGRLELIEDFPAFDRNGDGQVNDDDILIGVTLRSGFPDRSLIIPHCDSYHAALFFQDDWRVRPNFTVNLGVRYELDTDVNNVKRYDEINPIVRPFLSGERGKDINNFGPRIGFNWSTPGGKFSLHGGYGIFYDRVTLEIQSLERGLDGRALPVEVRAGNVFFIDPQTGGFPPFAPTISNPFTGFILPGAGASGINIIDNELSNPMVQQTSLGIQYQLADDYVLRADYLHNFGTHFIIGRTIGIVFNPVVGGPDRVVNLESSVKTKYDGLLLSLEKRFSDRYQFRASYTLSKAFNYANDDQIPFGNGPVNPDNLQLEYAPTPNDQRHRFTFSGSVDLPMDFRLSAIWNIASGVPMDILYPGPNGNVRIPFLQRNAGGRLFDTGAELNAFIQQLNAGGALSEPLPLVADDARFNDGLSSFDMRVSKVFRLGERVSIEPIAEVFNLFNVTNVLGVSNQNYSGFSNVLLRDSGDPSSPGYLRSSSFGQAITTAGGVFGSGGPRAFQFAVRVAF